MRTGALGSRLGVVGWGAVVFVLLAAGCGRAWTEQGDLDLDGGVPLLVVERATEQGPDPAGGILYLAETRGGDALALSVRNGVVATGNGGPFDATGCVRLPSFGAGTMPPVYTDLVVQPGAGEAWLTAKLLGSGATACGPGASALQSVTVPVGVGVAPMGGSTDGGGGLPDAGSGGDGGSGTPDGGTLTDGGGHGG